MARVRRVRGEGSIYQRESDGRWVGVVDMGFVGVAPNRRRLRKTVSATTKRECQEKFKELRATLDAGVMPTTVTVDAWMQHWLDDVAPGRVRPRTLEVYRGYVRRYISPSVGHYKLVALRPEHVRALHKSMTDRGLSSTTTRQAHMILQRALEVAVLDQRLTSNPATRVDRPKALDKTHGVLSPGDVRSILTLLTAYGDDGETGFASRFLVALLGGLRQGEALGLRWEDVDLTPGYEGVLLARTVQRQKGKGLVEAPLKTAKSARFVPLLPPLVLALRRHQEATGGIGYVWGGDKPTDPRRDWGDWKGLLWSADVEDKPLHAARATTASILHEARVPLKTIADILGHAQITTAWTHYVHTDDRQMREGLAAAWAVLHD